MLAYKKKIKPIPTDVSVKVEVKNPIVQSSRNDTVAYRDSLEEFARLTAQVQKRLRIWWESETGLRSNSDFILVATQNNKAKYVSKYSIRVDLTQLSLTNELISKFEHSVKKEVERIVQEYA